MANANVVTWQSPNGERISICRDCEVRLAGKWPKDSRGEEYAQVYHGSHRGRCDGCEQEKREDGTWRP